MKKVDQIIHARWLITCQEQNQILEDHSLVILEGKIIDLLPSKQVKNIYDTKHESHFSKHAIMPGFVNSHTHLAMNLFKGFADDLSLMEWLNEYIWPSEAKWVSEEFVYDGSLLAIAEMIRSGTTTFNDMYFFLHATADAAIKSGIRAGVGMTIIDVPTAWAKTSEEYFERAKQFYQEYKGRNLIIPTLAPHSTYTVSIEHLERVKGLAEQLNIKVNIHLQESLGEMEAVAAKYRKRPIQLLNEIGLVSSNLIAIHMTQINEEDMEILMTKKPNIVHCPESNMKLASGACPVQTLLDAKINVALGTDGAASNNDLNMISEMRSAAFLGKLTANDSRALNSANVLKMATLNGAKALGIEHITGSLEVGKSADFIAIQLDDLETLPLYHPGSHIIYASDRSQVSDVWVCGKQLLKNKKLTTLDEEEIIAKAKSWQKRLEKVAKRHLNI